MSRWAGILAHLLALLLYLLTLFSPHPTPPSTEGIFLFYASMILDAQIWSLLVLSKYRRDLKKKNPQSALIWFCVQPQPLRRARGTLRVTCSQELALGGSEQCPPLNGLAESVLGQWLRINQQGRIPAYTWRAVVLEPPSVYPCIRSLLWSSFHRAEPQRRWAVRNNGVKTKQTRIADMIVYPHLWKWLKTWFSFLLR